MPIKNDDLLTMPVDLCHQVGRAGLAALFKWAAELVPDYFAGLFGQADRGFHGEL